MSNLMMDFFICSLFDLTEHFSIKNTMVGGSLPTEIGNMLSLRLLDLTNSSLTGSIPSEFGKLNGLNGLGMLN
jgi:hypothetical protein